jgi:hypothetical protein
MSRESFTREWRQAMAKSTVKDINAGYIKVLSPAHQGTWRFDIASQLLAMCHGTEYCRPDSLRVDWKSSLPPIPPLFFGGTIIEVLYASSIRGLRMCNVVSKVMKKLVFLILRRLQRQQVISLMVGILRKRYFLVLRRYMHPSTRLRLRPSMTITHLAVRTILMP